FGPQSREESVVRIPRTFPVADRGGRGWPFGVGEGEWGGEARAGSESPVTPGKIDVFHIKPYIYVREAAAGPDRAAPGVQGRVLQGTRPPGPHPDPRDARARRAERERAPRGPRRRPDHRLPAA